MNKHLKYGSYVIRHKWFVFLECCKLGIPWLGIVHDLSKFRPSEWFPYADHFYGPQGTKTGGIHTGRNATGYYRPTNTGDAAFDFALHLHLGRNRHHWQWWTQADETEGVVTLVMSHDRRLEMLADFRGASRAQGSRSTVAQWYIANGKKMQLHQITRNWLETLRRRGEL